MTLPVTKRVRWDDSVLEICERSREAEKTQPNVATPPDNGPPLTSCKANEAIRLYSVRSVEHLSTTCAGKDLDQRGFRPEFTHQLFDEERIEGYREGDVSVHLVYTAASLHFLVKIRVSDGDTNKKSEILSRLSKALPPSEHYTTDEAIFCQQLEKRNGGFKPPGNRVHEYHKNSKAFSVYRATGDDPGAREYHDRAQCLAPWFIESADSIDLEDDRWEVFYVFEEKTLREVLSEKWLPEAFVGYFTVFGFRNPVKGASLRICQALILPQFQRQGHGQALLTYLYDLARSRESVFEVTVEDPSPGFEKVRNLVDARTLRDHKVFPEGLLVPGSFQRPPKDVVQAAHEAVKLTVSQVEIGFDILKARNVEIFTESPSSTEDDASVGQADSVTGKNQRVNTDDTRKRFRLMVKRRLLKHYGEELSVDPTTRKSQLDELYRDVEEGLLSLGTKLKAEEARDESKTA